MYKTLTTQTLLLGQALDCNSSPTLASRISQVGQRDSVLSTKKICKRQNTNCESSWLLTVLTENLPKRIKKIYTQEFHTYKKTTANTQGQHGPGRTYTSAASATN